jgi:hypothetical protein
MAKNELAAFGAIPFSPAALAKPKTNAERGFASRLQFISTGSSKLVSSGKCKVGHYALVDGEQTYDLGPSVTVIPLGRLDKAIDFSGDECIVAFGEGTPEYESIKSEVTTAGFDSGCMYGPVFLCYEVKSGQFVELFLNNASGRNEAENINTFLPVSQAASDQHFEQTGDRVDPRAPRAAILGSKEVTSKRGKKTYVYSVPTTSEAGQISVGEPPTQEQLTKAVNNFFKQAQPKEEEGRDR